MYYIYKYMYAYVYLSIHILICSKHRFKHVVLQKISLKVCERAKAAFYLLPVPAATPIPFVVGPFYLFMRKSMWFADMLSSKETRSHGMYNSAVCFALLARAVGVFP